MTEDRIRKFFTGEATGESTDFITPVFEVDGKCHQFYFEMNGKRLLLSVTDDGQVVARLALDCSAVCELAKIFSAARGVMDRRLDTSDEYKIT